MAKYILLWGNYKIFIYDLDHPGPHFHVIHPNEDETVVNLPGLTIKHGPALPRQLKAFLLENLETLCNEFDIRHPKK